MARETVTREIGGDTFIVTPLPASKGWRLLVAIGKLVGAPLGTAAGSAGPGGLMDARVGGEALGRGLAALADRIDEEQIADLTRRLLETAQVRQPSGLVGVNAVFDVLFMGRYMLLLEVLMFALEVNFDVPLAALIASLATEPTGDVG